MAKKSTIWIISLSILATAGVGYFVWSRYRLRQLNSKVSSYQDAVNSISAIDVSNVVIAPQDITTEPEVPLYSGGSDDIGAAPVPTTGYINPNDTAAWDTFFDDIWNADYSNYDYGTASTEID